MGLIGSLLKGIGKVAKVGASVLTHGVSDKVLSAAKQLGRKPTAQSKGPKEVTQQQQALINKIGQASPRVRITEVISDMRAGGGLPGTYKRSKGAAYKKKPRAGRETLVYTDAPQPNVGPRAIPKRRSSTGVPRRPPSGGLDLARMAKAWRAAGKPGTWKEWIRTQPIRKA